MFSPLCTNFFQLPDAYTWGWLTILLRNSDKASSRYWVLAILERVFARWKFWPLDSAPERTPCGLEKQDIKGNFPMTHKIVLILFIGIKTKQLAELITWIWKAFTGSDDNSVLRKDWQQTIRYFVNSMFWHKEFWF